jgi:hypothetical protein
MLGDPLGGPAARMSRICCLWWFSGSLVLAGLSDPLRVGFVQFFVPRGSCLDCVLCMLGFACAESFGFHVVDVQGMPFEGVFVVLLAA